MSGVKVLAKRLLPEWMWTNLRTLRRRQVIRQYAARDVRHNYGGVPLTVHLADPLGEGWYDRDWSELPEIALLRRGRLRPGARVFDLGAHQGVVALMLAHVVGAEGLVVAVEASGHNAKVAERNRAANGVENVRILHAAAADKPGSILFNDDFDGQVETGAAASVHARVRAVSVDELAGEFGGPDVLFIDVEGFETQVLRGASKTLATLPECFVEVHVGVGLEKFESSADEVLGFFPTDKYEIYLGSESQREMKPLAECRHLMRERFFMVCLARRSDGPAR